MLRDFLQGLTFVVLGVLGLRGPTALVFSGGIYSSCPFQENPKSPGNTFSFFSSLFYPFLSSQPKMAASQVEMCGQEAGRELVSAGGRLRCNYLNLGVTHSMPSVHFEG